MGLPVGYFITFSTYGTWLHGEDKGSVDQSHNKYGQPFLETNGNWQVWDRGQMKGEVFVMDRQMREFAVEVVKEVCEYRQWVLHAVHARSNHVHAVVGAKEMPEKVMSDLKAWLTRRLREIFADLAGRKLWAGHGSTKYLWDRVSLSAAVNYVINEQGEPMAFYRCSEPEA